MLVKVLAQVCRICPACIVRRRYPDSGYGRFMEKVERACPFCRAYDREYAAAETTDGGTGGESS